MAQLQEFIFSDSRAIAPAVNSGRVPFSDILDLADHAKQFRDWLATQQPDVDIVKSYFEEAT